MENTPDKIKIRGGRVHNLKNIDVDIPLNKIVGVADFPKGRLIDATPIGINVRSTVATYAAAKYNRKSPTSYPKPRSF